MSFLDGILGKLAEEHGIDEAKMAQIKDMAGKVDVAEIAEKAGIPQEVAEKLAGALKK